MGILGIRNRTENWKTAQTFAPFFECDSARTRLAKRLLKPLGKSDEIQSGAVEIELFWYGMRDYINQLDKEERPDDRDLANLYQSLFPDLRKDIEAFGINTKDSSMLGCANYDVQENDRVKNLYSNLIHTEIDIVLKTPGHLFIGEAKGETTFRPEKKYVLMHQLIRQYVMATILICCLNSNKKVVPFVVGDDRDNLTETHTNQKHIQQVNFMIQQHNSGRNPGDWLKAENVLSWDYIEELAASTPGNG